jgi:hypothetical protein
MKSKKCWTRNLAKKKEGKSKEQQIFQNLRNLRNLRTRGLCLVDGRNHRISSFNVSIYLLYLYSELTVQFATIEKPFFCMVKRKPYLAVPSWHIRDQAHKCSLQPISHLGLFIFWLLIFLNQ